jgi:hypothetical protein
VHQHHHKVCPSLAVDLVKPYHPRAVEVRIPDDKRDKVQIEMADGDVWPVERRWLEALVDAHERLRDSPPQIALFS